MDNFLFIAVGIFALFLALMWFKYGVQPSISATYKLLPKKPVGLGHSIWLFLFFILAVGIVSSGQSAWYFGSAIGLLGVGAFPEYWEKDEVKKHIGSAYIAYLVPITYMIGFDGRIFTTVLASLWLIFAILCSLNILNIKNRTSVYEIIGMIVIVIGLM